MSMEALGLGPTEFGHRDSKHQLRQEDSVRRDAQVLRVDGTIGVTGLMHCAPIVDD